MRPPVLVVRPNATVTVCWRCSTRLPIRQQRASLTSTTAPRAATASFAIPSRGPRLNISYFLSNSALRRLDGAKLGAQPNRTASATTNPDATRAGDPFNSHPIAHLPHRRRQTLKRHDDIPQSVRTLPASTTAPSTTATSLPSDSAVLPPDASALLAHLAAKQPASSLRRRLSALLSLSKPRLTVLVVLSAMASYALYPVPSFAAAGAEAASAASLSPLTLLFLTTGTGLCSASANALNMLYEPATDAQMSRTRARPLVRGLLSRRLAWAFAAACGAAGGAALWLGVGPVVAGLGLANIALYAGAYTPLKRVSWLNTWVGALVGAIPPLMGWAAAAGESATGDGGAQELLFHFPRMFPISSTTATNDDNVDSGAAAIAAATPSSVGGWLLAGILFAWQFPHFMALSWGVREEYRAAGLRMLCWVNPARNARVALRYSLVFVPLCTALCAAGVTEWSFAVTSLPVNAWLARESVRFWRLQGQKGSARGLFWASVWHLPVVMVLALVQKKGMWGRVWRSIMGEPDEDDEWDEDEQEGGAAT